MVSPLTHWVTGKAWLCGPLLIRPLLIRPLGVGHLRVRHLRVGARGATRACLGEARLAVARCWWVWPHGGLAVVGRGRVEPWLRGSVDTVMKWVVLTHNRVSTLILGHDEGEGSLCYKYNIREEMKQNYDQFA